MAFYPSDSSIRVLIAGDQPHKLAEIKNYMVRDPGIKVLGEAANPRDAQQLVRERHPDILVLALTSPDEEQSEWSNFQKTLPDTVRTVMYTSFEYPFPEWEPEGKNPQPEPGNPLS